MSDDKRAARFWVVVPAAGLGRRFGSRVPKQYLPLGDRPLICHTLTRLQGIRGLTGGVVALCDGDARWLALDFPGKQWWRTATGGAERCDSVLAALKVLDGVAGEDDWVLVHDVARPCVMPSDILALMATLRDHPVGGILAVPASDTLKRASAVATVPEIEATEDRARLWLAQTPQMFRYGLLRRALESALAAGEVITDEASAVERFGLRPRLVAGRRDNLKVTAPGDLSLASAVLAAQALDAECLDEDTTVGERS